MWLVDARLLCRKHLLGNHVELHMLAGSIEKGKSLKGFIANNLIDTSLISASHNEIEEEMKRRGYKHNSPLCYLDSLGVGHVDINVSKQELINRCPDCRNRILSHPSF